MFNSNDFKVAPSSTFLILCLILILLGVYQVGEWVYWLFTNIQFKQG